jgi:type IV pilus assembly protein PilV
MKVNIPRFSTPQTPRFAQRGVSLIESLVALLVLALGVLGLLGFQLRTMIDNQNANQVAHAARLADELFERIKANPMNDPSLNRNANPLLNVNTNYNPATPLANAQWTWLDGYVLAWNTAAAAPADCNTVVCTPAQKVTWDLSRWKQSVEAALPGARVQVLRAPAAAGNPRQLIAIVGWRAKESAGVTSPMTVNIPGVTAPTDCASTYACYVAYGQP